MRGAVKKSLAAFLIIVLTLASGVSVFGEAGETELEQHTLGELQERAVVRSRELARLRQVLNRSEIMQREAYLQRTFTPVGRGTTFEEFAASQAILGLLSAGVQIELNQKRIETEEEKIAYDVLVAWHNIMSAQRNLELARHSYALAESELTVANLQSNVGTISRFQQIQAKNAFADAKVNVSKASLNLRETFEEINALTGRDADYRFVLAVTEAAADVEETLTEEATVSVSKVYEEPNLQRNINRVLARHPDLWALGKQVELAEWGLHLYTFNQGQAPYAAQEIDVQTATISLRSGRQQVENMVRNLAISLQQLENERVTLEINVKQAEENLRLAKLRLEVGVAVPLDVMRAQRVAMQLENGVKELDAQYERLLKIFEKPWVATGMPGQ